MPYSIEEINNLHHDQFIEVLGGIFEHSPWIADKAGRAKPFISIQHLHQEMVHVVETAPIKKKLGLIQAHPNLGERVKMTSDSTQEQKGAGLQNLTSEEYTHFISMNQKYMEKFGFPFISAVRGKHKEQIYKEMETRIRNSKEIEFQTALAEIYKIAYLRLEEKIGDSLVL